VSNVESAPSLESLTAQLVWATLALAGATFILAALQYWGVRLQKRELRAVEAGLELNRQQIEVTREQLRPHLEVRDARWAMPGDLPSATVEYVSGSEAVYDVLLWFATQDGRRFRTKPTTPTLGRPGNNASIDVLPKDLEPTWAEHLGGENEVALTGDEWWAAVTWRAADGSGYGWMYIQRTHYVDHRAFRLPR
jgi:hypothetical protein